MIRRQATSIIGTLAWPAEEIDYEEDASKYIDSCRKKEAENIVESDRVPPDSQASNRHDLLVEYDENNKPYDALLRKVDIKNGNMKNFLKNIGKIFFNILLYLLKGPLVRTFSTKCKFLRK